ncbi:MULTISPECIES: HEAT repeat domain-containing protein [Ralstonia]|uniref:HEAT repeat domain-containing protein n=1 Tax=Ralstonia TaxID=48736 RepID=UPI0015E12A77|nr:MULTISPECIES: HEAT repeat domain-containing protein [Ralstonia]
MASQTEVFQALVDTLNGRESVELRIAAAEGLGILGGPDARAHLLQVLNGKESVSLRAAAARALGHATHR